MARAVTGHRLAKVGYRPAQAQTGAVTLTADSDSGQGVAWSVASLHPKAGGFAFALSAMGPTMYKLLDVTIVYPIPNPTFWQLLSGGVSSVTVRVRQDEVPPDLFEGNYLNDPEFREHFQSWVRELWQSKDELIGDLLHS